ncbi:unnamed protein product [Owenia fusiformis]|uniref:Uncharacterized protein n=1 Tax=Owenia fusiformis TaxID=6347 RepID=A0A8S4PDG7_OWEFU|nr:unnamed protein product [Owenia fusiformis]
MESANMAGRNVQTYTLENKNTLRKLATLRNEGQLCDLMFIFPDGSQIEAHKAIVCQYSSVIKARCVDIDQHKLQVLCTDIDNEQAINPSILNIMLDYIYGLSITIRHEYIQDIMRLAIKLNIPEFLGDCDKILFENKALGPSDLMINAQNIKQEQTGSGYETGQVSDFGMADQPLVTPSTSFDGANLQEPIDEKAAKPPGRRKRKATKVVKASVEQLPEPQSDEDDDMMDNPLDDDTDEYEADNFTAIKAEEADSDYNESASPKKRKRSKAKKTTVSTKRSHQKKTATLDPLFCKECDQKFDAYKDAAEHHKGVHNLIVCDVCAKIFDNEADLRRHSVLHSGNPPRIRINQAGKAVFQCDVCDKQFAIEPRCLLRNHSFKANSTRRYIEHLKTHHGDRPMICKICGVGKRTMSVYLLHQDMHLGMSVHVCRLCNKSFQHRDSLGTHLNHIHNEEYKRKAQRICEKCGKLCKSRAAYMYHKKSAHDEAGPVICDVCNKEFSNNHKLRAHYAYHQKTVLCPECGKQFTYKSKLQRHIRQMHSIKAKSGIPCEICAVMYSDKVALAEHMSTDHMTKPMDSSFTNNFYHSTSNFLDSNPTYVGSNN